MNMKSVLIAVGVAICVALGAAYVVVSGNLKSGTAGVGVALGAQIVCADVFLMHRSVKEAEENDLHSLSPAAKIIGLKADMQAQTVTATLPLVLSRTAQYRPGVGCTLRNEGTALASAPGSTPVAVGADFPTAPYAAVQAAVDGVFSATNAGGYPDTRAIVVVQDGRVVAERYAPGFTAQTPIMSWSMTKSVTSALVGVLVRQGRLTLDAPAPVPEWRTPGDPRGAITLRQLLTMSSGLKFQEDYVAGSDSSRMLFHEADMGAYAATRPLIHPPGAAWSYSSGTANVVARIVRSTVGGTNADFDRFAREELFAPLGLSSMLIEPDESGTPVGSSYGYATARDWARFGALYLNGGVAGDRRVLDQSWIDFTRTPTPAARVPLYGAMFWLNGGAESGPYAREYPHLPTELYLAEGHNGQFVAMLPSRKLIIVRLGWTPEGKQFDLDRHFAAILKALPAPA
ncbi:serine hydrolase [soil metagenome]